MNKKKVIYGIGAIIAVIGIGIIVFFGVRNYKNTHNKDLILSNFKGNWQVQKEEMTELVVDADLASFAVTDKGIVSYEDCTYEINDKYELILKGVNKTFTCKMKGNLKKMICTTDGKKMELRKYSK